MAIVGNCVLMSTLLNLESMFPNPIVRTRSSAFTMAVVKLTVKFNKSGKDKRSFLIYLFLVNFIKGVNLGLPVGFVSYRGKGIRLSAST